VAHLPPKKQNDDQENKKGRNGTVSKGGADSETEKGKMSCSQKKE
jgi:hypothetical protein